uniref:Uncharacterized protein n=1 Tax=viral metagenome TaxID=1070528 RepID=A0A6C0JZG1_9ZZZZ
MQRKQPEQEPKKFQFCDVRDEEHVPVLIITNTTDVKRIVDISGVDLLLDESWTTVQRKKRKTK